MRWHLGGIPDSPDFVPGAEWKALKEPTPWVFQLFAAPVALVLAVSFLMLWTFATPAGRKIELDAPTLLIWLLAFGPLIAVHELIHLWVHPGAGKSSNSIVGFWPSRAMFYAHYEGEMSRERFLAILAMPLLIISFLPLVLAIRGVVFHPIVSWLSLWNAVFASGDALGIMLILAQLPRRARVRNKSWKTY
jgi:hypothetical protein